MADDSEQKPPRSQADKERSRQQSRQVTGKEAAKGVSGQPGKGQKSSPKKAGQTKGGSGQRGQRPPRGSAVTGPTGPGRSPTTLLTWGVVGLVLVVVIVLVIVKISSGSGGGTKATPPPGPLSASVAQEVTHIPTSVYNTVGINSPTVPVTAPKVVNGKTLLKIDGKPGVFYLLGEFCPYCAAERWSIVASLSRFGTFSGLQTMQSSATDVYPKTQTFTFVDTTFASQYLGADLHELYSNRLNSAGQHEILKPLDKSETALVKNYDKGTGSTSSGGSIPFGDIGNKVVSSGASYNPAVLQGLSREEIAGDLSDPSNPVTKAIIATSNYQSAAICSIDGEQPAAVCSSKGVTAAAKALGISSS